MSVKPFKDYPRRCFYINRAEEARPEEYIGFRRKLTGKRKVVPRNFGENANSIAYEARTNWQKDRV